MLKYMVSARYPTFTDDLVPQMDPLEHEDEDATMSDAEPNAKSRNSFTSYQY